MHRVPFALQIARFRRSEPGFNKPHPQSKPPKASRPAAATTPSDDANRTTARCRCLQSARNTCEEHTADILLIR
jgi:hypothetical protein